jgi:hypothetical protein
MAREIICVVHYPMPAFRMLGICGETQKHKRNATYHSDKLGKIAIDFVVDSATCRSQTSCHCYSLGAFLVDCVCCNISTYIPKVGQCVFWRGSRAL